MDNHFNNSCDAFDCAVHYVHTYACTTYKHNSYDLNCAIPCFLSNCSKTIVHKWTMCPIWHCSTPLTPLVPSLPLDHPMGAAVIVLSLLATILLTIILTFVGIKLHQSYRRRYHVQLMPEDDAHNPIYGKIC
jgi:hypothetical protein